MEYLKKFYLSWSINETLVDLPKKQVFQSQQYRGDFRIMPCVINDPYNIKSVKIIGTNEENKLIKDEISVGKSFLVHSYDNHIYAMFDVCALSSFRTAAISALAYSLLYNTSTKKVGLIGIGRIGFYTALILHKWLGVDNFYCDDISEKNKENVLALNAIVNNPNMKTENILFISTGIAVQDALISQFIYDRLSKHTGER